MKCFGDMVITKKVICIAALMLNGLEASGMGNVYLQVKNCHKFLKCSGRWDRVQRGGD